MPEVEKLVIKADQVVNRKRGWVNYIDAEGTQRSIRVGHVTIEGVQPIEQKASTGESKVAKGNGKGKKAKKEGTGIRTIGGKAVDLSDYVKVKTAAGGTSYHNGDAVAERLAGKSLDEVYAVVSRLIKVEEKELRSKYKHLNVGMQRMALGNRARKGQSAAA